MSLRYKTTRTLFLILLILLLSILCMPLTLRAAEGMSTFVPLEKFSDSAKLSGVYASGELSTFLSRLFLVSMSVGAVLAVLRLAWAGFQYMASDLWSSKEHAKEIIRETLLGLFLLLGIWIILNQINPDILKLKVDINPLSRPVRAQPVVHASDLEILSTGAICVKIDINRKCTEWKYVSPTESPSAPIEPITGSCPAGTTYDAYSGNCYY